MSRLMKSVRGRLRRYFQMATTRLVRSASWPVRAVQWRRQSGAERKILLRCGSLVMAKHLQDFCELFQADTRLRFYVSHLAKPENRACDGQGTHGKLDALPEIGPLAVHARNWDLIVLADHDPILLCELRKTPALYIGHGSHNKSRPGVLGTHAYGAWAFDKEGCCLYRRMLAADHATRELAIRQNRTLSDVVVVVGSIANDRLLTQVGRRDEIRRSLGFHTDDVVVFVLSTWREECLFRTVGDAFLEESRKLLNEFKFILTIHPREFLPKPPGQRVWGEHLRTQRQYGYIVREPSEDWVPYMVACDVILTDHTCLAEYGVLLGKPIIRVPVSNDFIWEGSVTWDIGQFAPLLTDMCHLREALIRAQTEYPTDRLRQLAAKMNPYPGQSEERIQKEVYGLLGIQAPKAIESSPTA